MKTLLVLAALAALVAGPSPGQKGKRPRVVADVTGPDYCAADDPLAPCPGRLVTVKNPQRYWLWVRLSCGQEVLTDVVGPVRPRGRTTFEVQVKDIPGGLEKGQCGIDKWSRNREDVL